MLIKMPKYGLFAILCLTLIGCNDRPWNDPYPNNDARLNTLYTAFTDRPNHLDPARSYSEAEWNIICQIYEPPLQYHYLKRPYVLQPLTALTLPEITYYNESGERLKEEASADLIAYTDYIVQIKPGIYYELHPAFAKNNQGQYAYHNLSEAKAKKYQVLKDFNDLSTREVIAEDYVYQIKRLAEPHVASPIYGLMSQYIVGLKELRQSLVQLNEKNNSSIEINLQHHPLKGVEVLDKYRYRIRIKGKYPQFLYWLAMPFFAPIPWEVAQFYAQVELQKHNISLDWYPVGTGPFSLVENDPERRIVLAKNQKFRGELYPNEGEERDKVKGFLKNANKPLPLLDRIVFTLEKEDIPYWNKFLQGYYDSSGISSDNFSAALQVNEQGKIELSDALKKLDLNFRSYSTPSIWYWGFNMLDETLGGNTEKARKLREAITLTMDISEYIDIFLNGRGRRASGPIPPDIFGYDSKKAFSKTDLLKARALLKEIDSDNLKIYFDTIITGNPDEIAMLAWFKEQFEKVGIQLIIRGTDQNRFQEKLRGGDLQLFFMGWNADYPDPENFLFLWYGPNGSQKYGGENHTNYQNSLYDRLFEKMRCMDNNPERLALIKQMLYILDEDKPCIWGFYPERYVLSHSWVEPTKRSGIVNNVLKYSKINSTLRSYQQKLWNKPIFWPLALLFVMMLLLLLFSIYEYWKDEYHGKIKK